MIFIVAKYRWKIDVGSFMLQRKEFALCTGKLMLNIFML